MITEPDLTGDERAQLNGFLNLLRDAVLRKSDGLTDEQARRRLVPSELTTIAGLLGHLCYVESYWFAVVLDGRPDPWAAALTEDGDAEFRRAMDIPLVRLRAEYERQCRLSREIAAKLDLADEVPFRDGRKVNLRYVLIHLIEETGRHAGHLDLLRELIDGRTGE
ncbi:DinB family protein [Amycolatopsis nigrescens]|uniref:DinB family protein n=1 Tax=Amycolatopsis nigrescens TaxID=381445 RepID=UPI000372AEAA|nr:DinB family protein [Amycolatopsis nigrescens]